MTKDDPDMKFSMKKCFQTPSQITITKRHKAITHCDKQTILRRLLLIGPFCILIKTSLKFVPKSTIGNSPALVQICSAKPLFEPMLTWFTDAYMCSTLGSWVKEISISSVITIYTVGVIHKEIEISISHNIQHIYQWYWKVLMAITWLNKD